MKRSRAIALRSTVTVSGRGAVTLPAKLRAAMGVKVDDVLVAEITPEGILLRPAVTLPIESYSPQRVREFDQAEADLAKHFARRR